MNFPSRPQKLQGRMVPGNLNTLSYVIDTRNSDNKLLEIGLSPLAELQRTVQFWDSQVVIRACEENSKIILAKFHKMIDAKEMWEAIKSRFGGNDESKKMQKYILKQQFEGFSVSNSEGLLHKGYIGFKVFLSQFRDSHGQGILLKSAKPREIKIVRGEMLGTLEIRMGEDLLSRRTLKLWLRHRAQLSDASIEIHAYTQALKKVEAQLLAHQKGQLWYEEKIKFMKIDLDDKTDVLTYHKKLLAEAQKEKEDLKAKVEKWHNSS
ncbi:hypothetical protein Tco_0290408 [Tanacetum coccineum]